MLLYFQPDIIATGFIILLGFFYVYILDFKIGKKSIKFFAGILLLFICTASPFHFAGRYYLFSAQMTAHVILLLIASPLLVAGIPAQNRLERGLAGFSKRLVKVPVISWIAGVGVMWLWHIPVVYARLHAMNNMGYGSVHSAISTLMYIHLLSLLAGGVLFCWPLVNPYHQQHLSSLKAVLYLSAACVCCSLLGLLIAFAPAGTYTHYISEADFHNYGALIRKDWRISAAADQQIGGLIMWVPCCLIYLSASMYLLVKWFNDKPEIPSLKLKYPENAS